MGVDIRHIKMFLDVAEEGSITRAATRLHMAQPAASRAVADLERHLGVKLFTRSSHGVRLTPEGASFHSRAAAAASAFDDAVERVTHHDFPLRIGHSWSALSDYTTEVIRQWNIVDPGTRLVFHRSDSSDAGLKVNSCDAVILRSPPRDLDLQMALVYTERRVAAVPEDYRPLSDREELTMSDLAGEPLVVNTVTGTTRIDMWPGEISPLLEIETTTLDDWQINIAAGLGVGVTPASTSLLYPHWRIKYIPLTDAPESPVYIAWPRAHEHPRLKHFIAVIRDVVGTGRGEPL